MGFERGVNAIVAERSCKDCLEGRHRHCVYIREFSELNQGAVDAEDFIPLTPWCWCYKRNPDFHLGVHHHDAEMESAVVEMPVLECWFTWDVLYEPFPALIRKQGFDAILNKIVDEVEKEPSGIPEHWGEVFIAGQFDRAVEISVFEEDAEGCTIEDFQQDVMKLLAALRLEGKVTVSRVGMIQRDRK